MELPWEFHPGPPILDALLRYLSFGVGLDPRQAQMYGPSLGPILVGLCFGIVNFVTTGTAPGYSGATMNPARCFGVAVASGDWSSERHLLFSLPPFLLPAVKRKKD